uniref:Lipopolysaccharide N-acetylmannosaminouronosyltransferase n=1 Tax=Candidatus Aschnera chinzeii TaxID=1485666 RepID=A0AAT9G4N5_9ENTR|nr:MAG: lipopolysaccharide N-acetylmannosaminouronosyltransferase [Candidatus Aschnera chinzeii]
MQIINIKKYAFKGYKIISFYNISHVINYIFTKNNIKYGMLCAINAEKIIIANKNKEFYKLLSNAEYLYADGISIVIGIKHKYHNTNIIRIPGIDLWESIIKKASQQFMPIYLIGSKKEIIEKTKNLLIKKLNSNIVGIHDGYFNDSEKNKLFIEIKNSGAKIITVGLGSPKQEFFMHECQQVYSNALYMGVGGTYDVFAGYVKRAPKIWQKLGLEWCYRLLSQPTRIKRQLKLLYFFFIK